MNTISKFCKFMVIPLLLGFPIAVIAYRLQLWSMGVSFQIIKYTGYVSIAVFLIAILVTLFALFKKQKEVTKTCVVVALLLAIPVIGLSKQAAKAKSLPFLHQVSTDTVNLPAFDVIIALRGDTSNPLDYDREKLAPLQQAAYPELQSILSEFSTEQVFTKAVNTAMGLGWEIVAKNQDEGRIEAVDTTSLWAFKDDIAIRVQQTETGSKIDLRSISRVGGTDLGANAERIKKFITAFNVN
ncbi:DUF1499 domain-containing protein [Colwellia sp. 1_MG-2023]|uniref:DUF1499 domain-containing protein n=1 Tax=unclassified Colwellia TaxID=196834 RepID=UPI001C09015C|nr:MULTISPECIES: DUF1499 domain-containing protein [unclassified Colwellia]MBU2923332.1 DUF1499 domain-containing protein [Colwellia sp. C2M11]MDO6653681.1 DUF1499 domain-containing protein [Colwellia sp. 3_MG-2023]MDO6666492.1 DUF1499 domain-containing protein [Colwellia sp. 2_MG-2023]MDO6690873.1 DUF1499 domain-containing protein [Colwellia sp. 1_MG-2023]